MARLQILELPAAPSDERPPFILVVDQHEPLRFIGAAGEEPQAVDEFAGVAEEAGARTVLVFRETVDIPANEPFTPYAVEASETLLPNERARVAEEELTKHEIRQRIDHEARRLLATDLGLDGTQHWDELRAAVITLQKERDEARQWARHGYEIGQKHCGWSDHGVAPGWLTEGWPTHFDSCEHLKRAAEMDGQISRVRAAIEERRTEVAEFEAENKPSGWSDAVTVTCDRISDALRVFPPPVPVQETTKP